MVDANSNANASEFDSSWSRKYRSGDEDVIVRSDSFRHYSDILASLPVRATDESTSWTSAVGRAGTSIACATCDA